MTSPPPPRGSWVCYILGCYDGTLYTGITTNLPRRVRAHNQGTASKYTRTRRPVTVRYTEPCDDRSEASRRELAIKRLTRRQKLALIETCTVCYLGSSMSDA